MKRGITPTWKEATIKDDGTFYKCPHCCAEITSLICQYCGYDIVPWEETGMVSIEFKKGGEAE